MNKTLRCANCQTELGVVREYCSASVGTSCFGNEICNFTLWNDDITECYKDDDFITVVCPVCGATNVFITYEDGNIDDARLKQLKITNKNGI